MLAVERNVQSKLRLFAVEPDSSEQLYSRVKYMYYWVYVNPLISIKSDFN